MQAFLVVDFLLALLPSLLMLAAIYPATRQKHDITDLWTQFNRVTGLALIFSAAALIAEIIFYYRFGQHTSHAPLAANLFGTWVGLLVQLLGFAIGLYSSKHLQGEPHQRRYIIGLAGVLASVHALLLANHWLVFIGAWIAIGLFMHRLLCFYPERPFALLAAHKKRVADRFADLLLGLACLLAWRASGTGSLGALWEHLGNHANPSASMQIAAILFVLAVIIRTALLPVHGWITQVMEAPTPVSALLHAGVVNLGGYVLVFFAPLINISITAQTLLVIFGLASALFGGITMLTRVSIKVHLAWSTIGQMGFMLLECGLGLYSLAALHLLGHSLYKAHNFLAASSQVRYTRLAMLRGTSQNAGISMLIAPFVAMLILNIIQSITGGAEWPWWWTQVLALAWAPLLWIPVERKLGSIIQWRRYMIGLGMTIGLSLAASIAYWLPLGATANHPFHSGGLIALTGMLCMYLGLIVLQLWPRKLSTLRRWSFAAFYLDESYTWLALKLWPKGWASAHVPNKTPIRSSPSDS